MRHLVRYLLGTAVMVCLSWAASNASGVVDLLDRPAQATRSAAQSVLLDITQAGTRLVAVGERGIVILSDDAGKSWRQATVPTSVSLTAVQFPSPKHGWAVGHGGVVLHTEDGGETWVRQLDGKLAAQLALGAAQARVARSGRSGPKSEAAKKQLAEAERLVHDGPDKPFLALQFENDHCGFVVGAYGLIFRTEDAGKTWKPWMDRVDNPKGLHIYAIRTVETNLYLAGEQGLFLKSNDGGNSFTRIQTPYRGTYFTLVVASGGAIVLAGMKGNAYWSGDHGKTFKKIDVPIPVSFSAATALSDGSLLYLNQAGQFLASRDEGRTMAPAAVPPLPPVAAMVQINENLLMTVGVAGVLSVPVPKPAGASAGGSR
jgi:photosystem II stability/assembly factor-like uncharacterized protein